MAGSSEVLLGSKLREMSWLTERSADSQVRSLPRGSLYVVLQILSREP